MSKIITPQEAQHMADMRFAGDDTAWDSYFNSNYPLLIDWINKKLINMKEQNVSSFELRIDYAVLFDIFSEHPPSNNHHGMRVFVKNLESDLHYSGWNLVTNYYNSENISAMVIEAMPEVEEIYENKSSNKRSKWSFWPDCWR